MPFKLWVKILCFGASGTISVEMQQGGNLGFAFNFIFDVRYPVAVLSVVFFVGVRVAEGRLAHQFAFPDAPYPWISRIDLRRGGPIQCQVVSYVALHKENSTIAVAMLVERYNMSVRVLDDAIINEFYIVVADIVVIV